MVEATNNIKKSSDEVDQQGITDEGRNNKKGNL